MVLHNNIGNCESIPELLKTILRHAQRDGTSNFETKEEPSSEELELVSSFYVNVEEGLNTKLVKSVEYCQESKTIKCHLDEVSRRLEASEFTTLTLASNVIYSEERELIATRLQTPDGTIISSGNTNLTVSHEDKNGRIYTVCKAYQGTSKLTIYSDAGHDIIREHISWGTFGIEGDERLHFIILKNMTTDHIEAVLKTQRLSRTYKSALVNELEYRSAEPKPE